MPLLKTPSLLICPVCRETLVSNDAGLCCINNHQFDRARQGYFNLLQGHKKRSRNPGDDKTMVDARTQFLAVGYYQPVADGLLATIKTLMPESGAAVVMDAGCGEGYYTAQVKQAFPQSDVMGFDISKPAVLACSRKDKSVKWFVNSVNDIPVADHCVDIIISVFSRCDWEEFARVLKPDGHILVVGPGPEHLQALREVIYDNVRPYSEDKLEQALPDGFRIITEKTLSGTMALRGKETLLNLLAMTPHYWRVNPDQKNKLGALDHLHCQFDMRLYLVVRNE